MASKSYEHVTSIYVLKPQTKDVDWDRSILHIQLYIASAIITLPWTFSTWPSQLGLSSQVPPHDLILSVELPYSAPSSTAELE